MLTGLGVFGIVAALLFRFFLPGQVIKFPLNEYEVMVLQGTGVSYFNTNSLKEVTGATMRSTLTYQGDVTAADAAQSNNIAVWKSFVATRDITNNATFSLSSLSLAFDRRTGELINCCGNIINGRSNLNVSGQGYVWPFNSQKRSYQFYDRTLLRPEPARYAGTDTTAGITTYRYVETVTNQQIGTQTVPGSLVGVRSATVTLPEVYSATNTFWVDPVTGDPIKLEQNHKLTLTDINGATKLVLFHGDLTTTPSSVQTVTVPDRANLNKIHLIENVLPLVIGIVGVVLLIIGVVLTLLRRTEGTEEFEDEPVSSHA